MVLKMLLSGDSLFFDRNGFGRHSKTRDMILLQVRRHLVADGRADLSWCLRWQKVGKHLSSEFTVIVDKSTVSAGTAERARYHCWGFCKDCSQSYRTHL